MRRAFLIVPLLLAILPALSACPTASGGGLVTVGKALTDGDLEMAWANQPNQDAAAFTEQMKIVVALDGGGEVYTRLLVSNVARLDGRAELLAKLELPDERLWRVKHKKDRGEWDFGRGQFDATVNESTFKVSVGKAEVHVKADDFILKYTVTSTLPALRPTGGLLERGGVFYATTIPVPRGRAEGTLQVIDDNGTPGETIAWAGTAYVEHRATDLAPYRMAKRWFKVSEVGPERTVVFSAFERGEELGGGLQGWLMVATDDALTVYEDELSVRPNAWSLDDETGYRVPGLVFLSDRAKKPTFRAVIKANALTRKKDELKNLSALERAIVKRLMKPWAFRYEGAEYLLKKRIGQGERVIRGTTTYDYQQLKAD